MTEAFVETCVKCHETDKDFPMCEVCTTSLIVCGDCVTPDKDGGIVCDYCKAGISLN